MGRGFGGPATVLVVCVGLAGCGLQTQLVECGDLLCPAGNVCVADRCATRAQVEACGGIADGEGCTVDAAAGRCTDGACLVAGCGNAIIELDERCDDGNVVSGDGCRADCAKVEMCGDAVQDEGEGCDDGNANAADGCDACVATIWRAAATIGGSLGATTVGITPGGVAVDRDGNYYVSDGYNCRVYRVDASGVITTIAGTGVEGFSGDGGPATSAQLSGVSGIAVDGLGNVYFADRNNNRIRRIGPDGIITTVAGSDSSGFSGDNGPATSAALNLPGDVFVDGLGNLYIADTENSRVRRVGTDDQITTIAGTGTSGFSGDAGAATAAMLSFPSAIARDATGNLYIADSARVRMVDTAGVITTIAGNGGTQSTGDGGPATSAEVFPSSIAVDAMGRILISEGTTVRRFVRGGTIMAIAGIAGSYAFGGDGGPATAATLSQAADVAVGPQGEIFIADTLNHRIRRIDSVGVIQTIAGDGTDSSRGDGGAATSVVFHGPRGLTVDGAGNLYIADIADYRIRKVDTQGVITTIAGTSLSGYDGDGGPATQAKIGYPNCMVIDSVGNLYFTDSANNIVRRIDTNGIISTYAGDGTLGFGGDNGQATSAQLANPEGIALDAAGNLYIADTVNSRVRKVAPNGVITTIAGDGTFATSGDNGPAAAAQLEAPNGVVVDSMGRIVIADYEAQRLRRIEGGVITTIAGTTYGFSGDNGPATAAQFSTPVGLAIDANDNLYFSDHFNLRIRRVSAAGTITTVAGSGVDGSSGDGGSALAAAISYPLGTACGSGGTFYLVDSGSYMVRRVAGGTITAVAGWVDPQGMGPVAQARLADPQALALAGTSTLLAGGTSGTVQLASSSSVQVAAGRYPQLDAMANLARYRGLDFGNVGGVAVDAATSRVFVAETSNNRVHVVTMVTPGDVTSWTIQTLANTTGAFGFLDGAAATARFRGPTGLYFDAAAQKLLVADTGNHVIRAIDLSAGVASATVTTIAGRPATRGMFGDGGAATMALLNEPRAMTRCPNGDLFIADTSNQRVRRVAASTNAITTVLGDGVAASSGEGAPASTFPVDRPLGVACDALGNVFATSSTALRLVAADDTGTVDGTGLVQTIYGAAPRLRFPASVTSCLTGVAVVNASTVEVVDSCTGLLVSLARVAIPAP